MREMIERVATIVLEIQSDALKGKAEHPDSAARRLIQAMREPTEAMVDAAFSDSWSETEAAWTTMIDTALKPPTPEQAS